MKLSQYFSLTILSILYFSTFSQAQQFKLNAGLGFIDGVFIGADVRHSSSGEIGIQHGIFPASPNNIHLTSFQHRLFLGKSKSFKNLETFYFGQGIMRLFENNGTYKFTYGLFHLNLGKSINFSESAGMGIELGALSGFYANRELIDPDAQVFSLFDEEPGFGTWPTLRIYFFARI